MDTRKLDATAAELLEELAALAIRPLQPGEITRADICNRLGCKRTRADRIIEEQIAAGKWEYAGERMVGQHRAKAWRKVKP